MMVIVPCDIESPPIVTIGDLGVEISGDPFAKCSSFIATCKDKI